MSLFFKGIVLRSYFLIVLTGQRILTPFDAHHFTIPLHFEQQLIDCVAIRPLYSHHDLGDMHPLFAAFDQRSDYGRPLRRTVHCACLAQERPPAGGLVKTTSSLLLLDVATPGIQSYVPRVALQHKDGVGRAGQTVSSTYHVKGIIGLHFADVVDYNDGDSASV